MQIAVHRYLTTERVGTLDIDEVSGAVRCLEGPPELQAWALEVAEGFYTKRSHCTAYNCHVGTWINLPWQREFSRELELQFVHMQLCTEVLAAAIRNHPNFKDHPWRRARRDEPAPKEGPPRPVRYRILEASGEEASNWWTAGIAVETPEGTVARFALHRLFGPLDKSLDDLGPEDFPEGPDFGSWRPGPVQEGWLPAGGTLLDFCYQTYAKRPEGRGAEEEEDLEA